MRPRERGATFLGIVIILLILGSALYAGIRLVPVYLEYTKVARSLEQVRDENAANDTNPQMIRRALEIQRSEIYHLPLHRQVIPWAARSNIEIPHRADNQVWPVWAKMK